MKNLKNPVSLNKMSKKAQKAYFAQQRSGWGGLNPVTRCNARTKAYNRALEKSKARKLNDD